MNLDKLNQWLTLIANVGVLAGIFFLAIEMRQNTEMMQAQTRDAITEKLANWYMDIATEPSATQILYYGNGNIVGELDIETGEGLAYRLMVLANLRLWENELYQYEKGLFEEDEFISRKTAWEAVMQTPGYRPIWESGREQFSPRFREEIDSMLRESTRD